MPFKALVIISLQNSRGDSLDSWKNNVQPTNYEEKLPIYMVLSVL